MKKLALMLSFIMMLAACSEKQEQKQEDTNPPSTQETGLENQTFSFEAGKINPECETQSKMLCAINEVVKCTLNPKTAECSQKKDQMPSFIFMEDESLGRPTKQSYEVLKIKQIANGQVEVYTKGECDGTWFGLCKGNIIYVMQPEKENWTVKDIYALENL